MCRSVRCEVARRGRGRQLQLRERLERIEGLDAPRGIGIAADRVDAAQVAVDRRHPGASEAHGTSGSQYLLSVDGENGILAGHGRVLAAIALGMDVVPVIELGHLTEDQKKAYVIADNKLALNAGWDQGMLTSDLEELAKVGFDVGLTGFTGQEILAMAGQDTGAISVRSVPTSGVADRFWISIRGPLRDQADAIQRLRAAMADLADVQVELGTTELDF